MKLISTCTIEHIEFEEFMLETNGKHIKNNGTRRWVPIEKLHDR